VNGLAVTERATWAPRHAEASCEFQTAKDAKSANNAQQTVHSLANLALLAV